MIPTYEYLKNSSAVPRLMYPSGLLCGARLFVFDKFSLLSCAVGTSSDQRLINECASRSKDGQDGKYNTFYFNSSDLDFDKIDAKKIFHWLPVKDNPIWHWSTEEFLPIRDALKDMVEVGERHEYLAMGCDGNKHRGPSVFAMFLSLAGVEPKEATRIANKFFGCNFVLPFVRARIAKLGYDLGNQNPELRARAQRLFE
jgi:hypothetical protein